MIAKPTVAEGKSIGFVPRLRAGTRRLCLRMIRKARNAHYRNGRAFRQGTSKNIA